MSKFFKLIPSVIKKDCVVELRAKGFGKQVALHKYLYCKLTKFACDNECEDSAEWNKSNEHWGIHYEHEDDQFVIYPWKTIKFATVYFSSKEGAEQAIEKVVKPFMKEHPDFVW